MAKKQKLPKWLLDSAEYAMSEAARLRSLATMEAKYPETPPERVAWEEAHDAWLAQHPRPEYDEAMYAKRRRLRSRESARLHRGIATVLKGARAGRLTAEQLLKAVEEF